ncbi:fungal-specific transcription factor domain-containing protein [Tricladium varicosporioides]|nr:fungal-specific transcription factor domain-containing protein [Hymenoscyphus varicosporioides]
MLASPSQTPESVPTAAAPPVVKITRGHSCVLCQQRKVKCDRQKPCSNCIKARAECVASTPTLPRRRRRKFTETDLATRLKKYEHLLKKNGIKIEDDEDDPSGAATEDRVHAYREYGAPESISLAVPRARNAERGALFTDKENSHYVENTLWENLRDEIQDSRDPQEHSSSDDGANDTNLCPIPESFLLGHNTASKSLTSLHPQPVHIFRMWQTFLVNVNPLVKLFHAPTVQQIILDASGDLGSITRPTEALMFSIYFLAVLSLANDECESMFGESRSFLIHKYSHATQQALINSRFMKTLNMTTLQALTLYILGVRKSYDPHSIWILTGVTVRIAQRLGLHRDGSRYDISVFDAEMRRRTWWQIVFLDGHASKLAGAGFPAWLQKFDTNIPANISDSDLSPSMKEPPVEKEGATEMIFCSLRYEVAQALRSAGTFTKDGSDSNWHIPTGWELIAEKDKAIDELEKKFQEKYVKYCDPSIPLHLIVQYVAKSVISSMRIMAHHPRQYTDKGATMPQSEKDMLFEESLKEMEVDSLGHTIKAVRGYYWHIQHFFQLDAFIYVLSELRYRLTGEMVDRAWEQVKIAYDFHPEFITDTKNALYVAIGNLAVKAYRKREEVGLASQSSYTTSPPAFISQLRAQRNIRDTSRPTNEVRNEESYIRSTRTVDYTGNLIPQSYQNTTDQFSNVDLNFDIMEMPEITSVDWEYWQTLMDGDLPAYNNSTGGNRQNYFL